MDDTNPKDANQGTGGLIMKYDFREGLAKLNGRVPVMVVGGKDDPFGPTWAQEIGEAFGVKPVVIDNAGHLIWLEQKSAHDQLERGIKRFLAQTN